MMATTLTRVIRAELTKAMGVGGIRKWLIAAIALGNLAGIGAILLSRDAELNATFGLTPAGVAGFSQLMVLLCFTIATATLVTREIDEGLMTGTKFLVSHTPSLLAGRLVAWFILVTLTCIGAAAGPFVYASIASAQSSPGVLVDLAGLAVSTLAIDVVALLTYCASIILRKGAYVVAAALFLLLVLPLLVAAVGAYIPPLVGVVEAVTSWMIGTLLFRAVSLPGDGTTTVGQFINGWIGMLIWLGAAIAMARQAFCREGFGEG